MPDKSTIQKAKKDEAEGKSASTQAGEFVHDEIEKVKNANSILSTLEIGTDACPPLPRSLLPFPLMPELRH